MAAFLQTIVYRCIFVNEKFCITIRISIKFVPKDLIDNKSALVQGMASCQTDDTGAYMWH